MNGPATVRQVIVDLYKEKVVLLQAAVNREVEALRKGAASQAAVDNATIELLDAKIELENARLACGDYSAVNQVGG